MTAPQAPPISATMQRPISRWQPPDDQREVVARRVGRKVILEPADEWSAEFVEALGSWSDEIDRPKSRPIAKHRIGFVTLLHDLGPQLIALVRGMDLLVAGIDLRLTPSARGSASK
jgi:hypothetical protein